jgi:AsmA-like C-terminal region
LKGKIAVKGAVTIDRAHATTLDATADITQADIAIDTFGIRKPAGEAGTTDLSLVFDGDTVRHIPHLKVASTSLNLAGLADFGADGSLQHADFSRFTSRRNDLALTVDTKPGAPQTYVMSLKGAQFDAAPLLAGKSDGKPPTHTPHLELTVGLDRLMTGAETKLDQVAGTLTLSGGRLDRADVKAMAGGPLTLSYVPAGDVIALHLAADDAGAALSGLGLTRGVKGGTLHFDGTTDPGRNPWRTSGTLDLAKFRLTDAPIAARLVNAVSPTGFVDLVKGQGLGFDRLSANVDYADGKITLRDGRSAGALGISFEGDLDMDHDKVALKGTIVPVDTFNKIVAAIPIIGDALTGGSRGGFLGWTYSVSGATNDPQVSVNPLSVFAPGFLRNLFFLGPEQAEPKGNAPVTPTPESAKQ